MTVATTIDSNSFSPPIQQKIYETIQWHTQIDRIDLTEREQEVLQIMSMAWSDSLSAQALNIALSTYRSHRKNIINKFNARNQVEVVAKAFRSKLVS